MKDRRFWMMILPLALVFGLVLGGCLGLEGDDGNAGKSAYDIAVENGFVGSEQDWLDSLAGGGGSAVPGEGSWFGEYCVSCHADDGTMHQASYDELYQVGVIEISDLAYAYSTVGASDIVTLEMTKFGNPFDCTEVEALDVYFTEYTGTSFEMADGRLSLGDESTAAYNSTTNVCTMIAAESGLGDLNSLDGAIVAFGRDEEVGRVAARVRQNRYPFGAVTVLGTVDYESPADVAGCEKCHTVPFLKHGYELADVGVEGLEFYLCKACHLDNGDGGHFIWQLLVDDPQLIFELEDEYGEDWEELAADDARLADYQYKTRLMNDVHMSHAMEFAYPQSMSNCATCHEGYLDVILTQDYFTLETCKSCHPVNGGADLPDGEGEYAYATTDVALYNLMPGSHSAYDEATNCAACHTDGGGLAFNTIHTGYDSVIYTDDNDGTKYADVISVSIDSATLTGTTLGIEFSASGTANGGSIDSVDIIPTVMVGLYGQDTKDFLVGPHARDVDGDRNLEFDVAPGETHPRYAVIDSTAPTWAVEADLSHWAYLIDDGTIWRAEICITADLGVAIDAVCETFDLDGNTFTEPVADIVRVEDGCNNCHDALGTTFHGPDRGGSVVMCRMCHITLSGGSHLEMQSRSIDSYVHAIHKFQPFDVGRSIDFTDPVEELHYEHHIESTFPTFEFGCEACHNPGTYDVPSQYDSMPGLLSASRDTSDFGWDREIVDIPERVTGPAARACGSCHKVDLINEDEAAELEELHQHLENYGYLWENDDDDVILNYIVDVVFSVYAP